MEIINVHSIKEFKDRYKIKCDYNEKIDNKNYVDETITIYKFYDDYEEIYNYLKK